MDFLKNLKAHLVKFVAFFVTCPTEPPSRPQQQQPPLPSTATSPADDLKLISILAAQQQYLQWKNSVVSFCFAYALGSFQYYAQTNHGLDSSFVLFSFLVLLTFQLLLVSLFISPKCTKTSELLDKVAFLIAAAAFSHAIAIPFPFELKCIVFVVFLLSLLFITIFNYFKS